jgi:hypothetical protein
VLEIPVALVRPRFGVDGLDGDLLQAGSLGIRFGLAVELLFWGDEPRSRRRSAAIFFDENRRTRR